MLFGAIRGAVVVVALLAVCSLLSDVPGIGTPIYEKIDNTKVTRVVYKYVDEFIENNLTEENVKDVIDRIVSEVEDKKDTDNESTSSGNTASGNEVKAIPSNL